MYEQLNSAFDVERPNSIQYSGPITQTPDHGVSQMMGRCTRPDQADKAKLFFTTLLLPVLIKCQQGKRWLDLCCTCYNYFEPENSCGPGVEITLVAVQALPVLLQRAVQSTRYGDS